MSHKRHLQIVAAVFVIVCALSAFLGWACGYNFDERNPGVAMWCFVTLLVGYVAACKADKALDEIKKEMQA